MEKNRNTGNFSHLSAIKKEKEESDKKLLASAGVSESRGYEMTRLMKGKMVRCGGFTGVMNECEESGAVIEKGDEARYVPSRLYGEIRRHSGDEWEYVSNGGVEYIREIGSEDVICFEEIEKEIREAYERRKMEVVEKGAARAGRLQLTQLKEMKTKNSEKGQSVRVLCLNMDCGKIVEARQEDYEFEEKGQNFKEREKNLVGKEEENRISYKKNTCPECESISFSRV